MAKEDGAMLSSEGMTTIVRQQTGDQLLISACGRTCSIDMHHSHSIVELQGALQRTLQMEGQAFHICDINGQLLSTDMQVQDAISQGLTPLCATLPDKSLHHLENRREDLAQMQWKLVRDQMTQSANQATQLTRQMGEMQFQVQALQRDAAANIDHFRQELIKAIEAERFTTKTELQPVEEAINGAVLLLNGERNKRELSVQGFEKHIHGVCDMIDGERVARRQDLAMHMTVMQELRSAVDTERYARQELEEAVGDMKRGNTKFQDDISSSFREQSGKLQQIQADAGVSATDLATRLSEVEDRSAAIQSNLAETTSWSTQSFDKLGERHERVSQAVETLRLSLKHHEGSIASLLSAIERVNELEMLIRQYGAENKDQMTKERQVRDDQVRRIQQVLTSESLKQITEVEKRLTVRLERESAEREKNFKSMIDEVTKIVEDRKLFRDQTITKTVTGVTGSARIGGIVGDYDAGGVLGVSPKPSYRSQSDDTILMSEALTTHEKNFPVSTGRSYTEVSSLGGSLRQSMTGAGGSRPNTPQPARVLGESARVLQSLPEVATPVASISIQGGNCLMIDSQPSSQPGSFHAPLGSAHSLRQSPRAVMAPTSNPTSPSSSRGAISTNSIPNAAFLSPRMSGSSSMGPSRLSGTQGYSRMGQSGPQQCSSAAEAKS